MTACVPCWLVLREIAFVWYPNIVVIFVVLRVFHRARPDCALSATDLPTLRSAAYQLLGIGGGGDLSRYNPRDLSGLALLRALVDAGGNLSDEMDGGTIDGASADGSARRSHLAAIVDLAVTLDDGDSLGVAGSQAWERARKLLDAAAISITSIGDTVPAWLDGDDGGDGLTLRPWRHASLCLGLGSAILNACDDGSGARRAREAQALFAASLGHAEAHIDALRDGDGNGDGTGDATKARPWLCLYAARAAEALGRVLDRLGSEAAVECFVFGADFFPGAAAAIGKVWSAYVFAWVGA